MENQDNERTALERIITDSSAEPIMLSYACLKNITNNFSVEIGRGGFGVVYMGFLRNGKVAVKILLKTDEFSEKEFEDELICLIRVKHKNIVRLLGYCFDTSRQVIQYNGQLITADVRRRLLCFEYAPNKSLHDYLKDKCHGSEWVIRYHLIDGICQGLHYLHNNERINHLDLKPENILLDADMVPKITDFGLSRCFRGSQSRIITKNIRGTPLYIAPEYWNRGEISFKSDIYSLGIIIIKLLRGSNEFFDSEDWHKSLDTADCPEVKRCIKIAQLCVNDDQYQRPTIDHIIEMLKENDTPIQMVSPLFGHMENNSRSSGEQEESCHSMQLLRMEPETLNSTFQASCVPKLMDDMQSMAVSAAPLHQLISLPEGPGEASTELQLSPGSSETSKLLELDVHPLELCFPFGPKRLIKCPVTLTNRTDYHVGVWITPTSSYALHYYFRSPSSPTFQMLEPHSTLVVAMTLRELLLPPSQDRGKFEVLMVAMGSDQHLKNLNLEPSIGNKLKKHIDFFRRVKELGGQVHREMLTAVICDPACCQAAVTQQIISTIKFGGVVYSIDVHPTEPWILMGHGKGQVCIWNYQTKERVMAWQVTKKPGMVYTSSHFSDRSAVYSAKFIARKQWFAAGDGYGHIHVYAYTTKHTKKHWDWVHKFEAHRAASVSLLAVHPTFPFLLSASYKESLIKLWDWDQRWVCTRTFRGHGSGVDSFTFNPRDLNMFASVDNGNTAKVWNIDSSNPVNTLPMVNPYSVDYLFADSHQHFLVACGTRSKCAYIWDLQTNQRVHSLGISGQIIHEVAGHPTLPILVTRLCDGTVCLWEATTYRLMEMVHLTNSPVRDFVFLGTKDFTRLVAGCAEGTAIMEINLSAVRTNLWTGGGSDIVHRVR